MEKMNGRHINAKLAGGIMGLEDDRLYAVWEVAIRIHDRKTKPYYKRTRDCLRKLANRNGMKPDNAERDDQGKVIMVSSGKNKGQPRLKGGELYPKYWGKKWKSALFEEDRIRGLVWLEKQTEKDIPEDAKPIAKRGAALRGLWNLVHPRRSLRRLAWTFLAALASFLLTAMVTIARFGADEIMEVYLAQGPKAALEMAFSSKDTGLEQYFALGWLYYQEDKYQSAKKVMEDLQGHSLSRPLKAKVTYTLGLLEIAIEKFDSAKHYLEQAQHLYTMIGDEKATQLVNLEFARILWRQGSPNQALFILDSTKESLGISPELIRLYMVIYAELKEYDNSLEYAEMLCLQDSPLYKVLGFHYKAYILTIYGQYMDALVFSVEADALIKDIGSEWLKRLNQLLTVHWMECQGKTVPGLRQSLEKWAIEHNKAFIINSLNDPGRMPCTGS